MRYHPDGSPRGAGANLSDLPAGTKPAPDGMPEIRVCCPWGHTAVIESTDGNPLARCLTCGQKISIDRVTVPAAVQRSDGPGICGSCGSVLFISRLLT